MIVSGLVHGLKSIVWILLLLLLIFYLFAVAGVLLFKANDKWHFGNIPIAIVSLFRAATVYKKKKK
jgi:voltage-gated sodium channel